MTRFTRWTCTALVTAGCLTSSIALAQSQAEARHREGVSYFKKWDFENARQSFLQAYALEPSAKFLWDLALAEAKANHPAEALRHFRLYFKLPDAKEADRRKAKPIIDEAEQKTGRVRVEMPAGATLSVDGERIDDKLLDAPVDVSVGPHTFGGSVGEKRATASVTAMAGQETPVTLRFESDTAVVAPPVAVPPPSSLTTSQPPLVPEETSPWPPTGTWVTGGIGVVGVGVGVGLLVAALSKNSTVSDANAAKTCADPSTSACATAEDAKSARNRDAVISGVGFGVGVVGLGAAVGWAVATHNRSPAAGWIVPEVGPGRAGLAVGAAF